jgi:hypothetical protein
VRRLSPRRRRGPGRRPWPDAVWGLGGQVALGLALGLVWLVTSPRPAARWMGAFWYAESDVGFGAAQDVRFALLTVFPGLAAGAWLVWRSTAAQPIRRVGCWLAGAALGALACWLTAGALSGAFAAPAVGDQAAAAPVALTSYGLLALWPFAAALAFTLALLARASLGRAW